jgi:hypothetical protein
MDTSKMIGPVPTLAITNIEIRNLRLMYHLQIRAAIRRDGAIA